MMPEPFHLRNLSHETTKIVTREVTSKVTVKKEVVTEQSEKISDQPTDETDFQNVDLIFPPMGNLWSIQSIRPHDQEW